MLDQPEPMKNNSGGPKRLEKKKMYEGGKRIRISHLQYLPHMAFTHRIGLGEKAQMNTNVNVPF